MQQYELLFILPGTLGEQDVEPAVAAVLDIIKDKGAEIVSQGDMGKSRLAYPMRHIRYGYFRMCRFEAGPEQVIEIQKKLRLMNDVLRVILKKVDTKNSISTIQFALPIQSEKGEASPSAETLGFEPPMVKSVPTVMPAPAEDKRIKLEDIDKKLDEILEKDIADQM